MKKLLIFLLFSISIFSTAYSKITKVKIVQPDSLEPFINGISLKKFSDSYILVIYEKNNKIYKLDKNFNIIDKYKLYDGPGPCEGGLFEPLFNIGNKDIFYNLMKKNIVQVLNGKCKKIMALKRNKVNLFNYFDYNNRIFVCSASIYDKQNKSRRNAIIVYKEKEKEFGDEKVIFTYEQKNIFHTPPEVGFINDNIYFFDRGKFTGKEFSIDIIDIKGNFQKNIMVPYAETKTKDEIKHTKKTFKKINNNSGLNIAINEDESLKKYIYGYCSKGNLLIFSEIAKRINKVTTYLHIVNTLTEEQKVFTIENKFIPEIIINNEVIGFIYEEDESLLSTIKIN